MIFYAALCRRVRNGYRHTFLFPMTLCKFYFSIPAAMNTNQGFFRAVMP